MADRGEEHPMAKGVATTWTKSSSSSESAALTPPSRNQSSGQQSQVAEVAGIQTPEKVRPLTNPTGRSWGFFPPEIFVGSWADSLGNSIVVTDSVRENQQCLLVKLTKPTGRVVDLEIRPTTSWKRSQWSWVCGNGSLDWWNSSQQVLWWITFDFYGYETWSRWDKRRESEASVQVQASKSPKEGESQPVPSTTSPLKKDTAAPSIVEESASPEAAHKTHTPQLVPLQDSGSVGKGQASSAKRIERVLHTWHAQDSSQMNASKGDFVDVWVGTETEQGWIYAESRGKNAAAGWLPRVNLQALPDKQKWIMAKRTWHAKDESQCSVNEESIVAARTDSKTEEGWVYVTSSQDRADHSAADKMGWVPVVCLEWEEVS